MKRMEIPAFVWPRMPCSSSALIALLAFAALTLTALGAPARAQPSPPLRAGEFAVQTANGCTVVLTVSRAGEHPAPKHFPIFEPSDRTEAGLRAWYGARNWTGECRAGFAFGNGLIGTSEEIAQLEKMKADRGGNPVLRRVPTSFAWGRVYPAAIYAGREITEIVQGGIREELELNGEVIVVQDFGAVVEWQRDANRLEPYTYLFAPDGAFTYTYAITCSLAREQRLVSRCRDGDATIYGYYIGKGEQSAFKPCPDMRTTTGCEAAWRRDTVELRTSIDDFLDSIRAAKVAMDNDPVIAATATAAARARVRARPANVAAIMRQLGVN